MACIELDYELMLNDLRLVQGANRVYIDFPQTEYGARNNMQTIVPLNAEVRGRIEAAVLEKYERKKERRK